MNCSLAGVSLEHNFLHLAGQKCSEQSFARRWLSSMKLRWECSQVGWAQIAMQLPEQRPQTSTWPSEICFNVWVGRFALPCTMHHLMALCPKPSSVTSRYHQKFLIRTIWHPNFTSTADIALEMPRSTEAASLIGKVQQTQSLSAHNGRKDVQVGQHIFGTSQGSLQWHVEE